MPVCPVHFVLVAQLQLSQNSLTLVPNHYSERVILFFAGLLYCLSQRLALDSQKVHIPRLSHPSDEKWFHFDWKISDPDDTICLYNFLILCLSLTHGLCLALSTFKRLLFDMP